MNRLDLNFSDIKVGNVAEAHLVSTTPTVTNWQPKTFRNPLPLNVLGGGEAVAEQTSTTKDAWFPVTVNLPGTNGTTPEQTAQALEEAKRRRMLWIAGGVLAALILLTVVLTMKKS